MAKAAIDSLFSLFDRFGGNEYGEDVTQLQHALQSAALARLDGCDAPLIAAALLHDIGQFIDDAGNAAERFGRDARHEELGFSVLSELFGEDVAVPVRLHVEAKRYLCHARPGYRDTLSRASLISLEVQGGAMTAEEAKAFEAHRYFADAVRLRGFDDRGKRRDWAVPDLESYRTMLSALLR